jgi:gas vesicle protein
LLEQNTHMTDNHEQISLQNFKELEVAKAKIEELEQEIDEYRRLKSSNDFSKELQKLQEKHKAEVQKFKEDIKSYGSSNSELKVSNI